MITCHFHQKDSLSLHWINWVNFQSMKLYKQTLNIREMKEYNHCDNFPIKKIYFLSAK